MASTQSAYSQAWPVAARDAGEQQLVDQHAAGIREGSLHRVVPPAAAVLRQLLVLLATVHQR